MATTAASRLLLAIAAVWAIPGMAAANGPRIEGQVAATTAGPGSVSREWLGRFGRAVAAAVPVSDGAFAAAGGPGDGKTLMVWGSGTFSRMAGGEDDLALDADVLTGTLGAERPDGPWLAGLALSRSTAESAWRRNGGGRIESSVTGIYPFTAYEIAERVAVWCAGGYGIGELVVTPDSGESLRTDLALLMAAAGARGDLVGRDAAAGPALSVEAAGLYATTTSAAGEADTHRLRLALEGSWGIAFAGGTVVTPALEVGVRRDGGDTETGFGADVGGRLAFADATGTLAITLSGRISLWHEASGLRHGDLSASLRLTTSW